MSSTYQPSNPPSQYDPGYLARELQAIKRGLEDANPFAELQVQHVEPSKLRKGMIAHADGTDWHPTDGTGPGLYFRNEENTAWTPIDPVANVRRFGAKGDGTTDDTAAIQAAIDSGAKYIYAPPGTYIHTLIELGEGQTLYGAGMYGGTKFKLKNGVAAYYASAGILGFTAKTGITECTFRDFEYDGNTANNRSWGNGSAAWTTNEYDLIYTQGIYFGTQGGRTAPSRAFLSNLYIHDTVRSSIVWGTTTVIGNNLHLKNSDADHLIYESGITKSSLTNVVCEGFARQGLVILDEGTTLNGLNIRNLAANPTIYDTEILVSVRNTGDGGAANISNVTVNTVDPDIVAGSASAATAFQLLGSTNISGVSYIGSNSAHTKVLQFFGFSQGQGSDRAYNISDVHAKKMGAKSRLVQVDAYATAVYDTNMDKITYAFEDGTPNASEYLFNFQGSVERFSVDRLTVTGTMMNFFATSASGRTCKDIKFRRVYCASVNGRACVFNSRENIVFDECDFQGASVTDLVSTSFFDEVKARNVRTGTGLYSNRGASTQSGNGATTSFVIAHGLETTPTYWIIHPITSAAQAAHTVTVNGTNLVITFSAAPASAADNLKWNWEASVTLPPSKA